MVCHPAIFARRFKFSTFSQKAADKMPAAHWDESSDDPDDFEYPDPCDLDDEATETITCPECGTDIYEDADQCPACGLYLIRETRIWDGKSTWWILLALLGIIAVIVTFTLGR